jgi:hypothetical protein
MHPAQRAGVVCFCLSEAKLLYNIRFYNGSQLDIIRFIYPRFLLEKPAASFSKAQDEIILILKIEIKWYMMKNRYNTGK